MRSAAPARADEVTDGGDSVGNRLPTWAEPWEVQLSKAAALHPRTWPGAAPAGRPRDGREVVGARRPPGELAGEGREDP